MVAEGHNEKRGRKKRRPPADVDGNSLHGHKRPAPLLQVMLPGISMIIAVLVVLLGGLFVLSRLGELELALTGDQGPDKVEKLGKEEKRLKSRAAQVESTVNRRHRGVPDLIGRGHSRKSVNESGETEPVSGMSVEPGQGRVAGEITAVKESSGVSPDTFDKAVTAALNWLKRTQNEDGTWGKFYGDSAGRSAAVTGLVLLTFLAHGDTPADIIENYGDTVRRAVERLVIWRKDHPAESAFSGAVTSLALCEAYNKTKLPFVKQPAREGLRLIVEAQQPDGGWGGERQADARWYASAVSWQIQALQAGSAAGLQVPGMNAAMKKAHDFLKNLAYERGVFRFSSKGKPDWAITAEGTLSLALLAGNRSPQVKAVVERVKRSVPFAWGKNDRDRVETEPERFPVYTWYHLTFALSVIGDEHFRAWCNVYAPAVLAKQKDDGYWKHPGDDRGKWYTTALVIRSLQLCRQHPSDYPAPLLNRDSTGDKDEAANESGVLEFVP